MPKSKEYLIHDNGGRPFKVIVTSKSLSIYKLNRKDDKETYEHFQTLEEYVGLWIGQDDCDVEWSKGNSILVQIDWTTFLFIGSQIVTFQLEIDVEEFHSPIGHSDVPYPWILDDDKNVYLLCDPEKIEYFPVSSKMISSFHDCASSDLNYSKGKPKFDPKKYSCPYHELWFKKTIPKSSVHSLPSKVICKRI